MGFQQGLSGLNATSQQLSVIGNNIANANTYGEKSSSAQFSDLYANALSGSQSNQAGIGTTISTIAQDFSQGSIVTTDNPLDLAINGGGFYMLKGVSGQTLYSRDGEFQVDKAGNVVNSAGQTLYGYSANAQGQIQQGALTTLTIPTAGIAPKATDTLALNFNLNSSASITAPSSGTGTGMSLTDSTTYNNATSITVYDAKGNAVPVTFYFQQAVDPSGQGNGVWNVYATANGQTLASESPDGNGNPTTPFTTITYPAAGGTPTFNPANAAGTDAPQLNIPMGTQTPPAAPTLAVGPINVSLATSTNNNASFAVTSDTQDGYAPGSLTSVSISAQGVFQANYSNGQSKNTGQLVLANFPNLNGLQAVGGNAWSSTFAAGTSVIGTPGSGNLGEIQSSALESSNVNLTNQLVSLVSAQRNYQANAQSVKTVDQDLQTLTTSL
ncbi:MAG: flagellar hook protein FlgE [Burkholderiaceae bacterium]|nr:flagellar hook protein FlgE [Burkholderiaceae bacterium]